jgi:hypothetical protein
MFPRRSVRHRIDGAGSHAQEGVKPGSALYVVWQQGRTSSEPRWVDSYHQNWNALWSTPADNVFLVKFSYWFSP